MHDEYYDTTIKYRILTAKRIKYKETRIPNVLIVVFRFDSIEPNNVDYKLLPHHKKKQKNKTRNEKKMKRKKKKRTLELK